MLFFATMVSYMDRQVLSLTWKDFIAPEFGWNDDDYGIITAWFSIFYAVFMIFAGRIIDMLGTKKGYAYAVGLWSVGAMMHALCGIATCGITTGEWSVGFESAKDTIRNAGSIGLSISTVSVYIFMLCRFLLGLGEAGNFPAANKVTAEYFPKKDRAFATSIFNNGASVGALFAPITIPLLAQKYGWEMAFIIIGSMGYIWVLMWLWLYNSPQNSKYVNPAELKYIAQDGNEDNEEFSSEVDFRISIRRCLKYKQTWVFIVGKFMTDCVWWFYLFWTPAYISDNYGYSSDSPIGMALIFATYLITMFSIAGGYLPTYLVEIKGLHPYECRLQSMFYFAIVPVLSVFIYNLGLISPWYAIAIIGLIGAAHQSWSACLYSIVGDLFPKNAIATITGIGGMAGGISSCLTNLFCGQLFTHAEKMGESYTFFGATGKHAAYFMVFCFFSVAYLLGWCIMKLLLPKYKPVIG